MRNKIFGVSALLVIGIIITAGYLMSGKKYGNDESTTEVIPSAAETPTSTLVPSVSSVIALKNVSAEALTCTKTTTREYAIELRLKNLDVESKSVTIYPQSEMVELLPRQIKIFDIILPYENKTLKLIINEGEELEVSVPPCVSGGGSGGGSSGANPGQQQSIATQPGSQPAQSDPQQSVPTSPAPIPEPTDGSSC